MSSHRYVQVALFDRDATAEVAEQSDEEEPLVTTLPSSGAVEKAAATGVSWRSVALVVSLVTLALLVIIHFAPAAVSSHLPPQLFVLRSAFSLLSVTSLPSSSPYSSTSSLSSSTLDYDPFVRISPATSTYPSHVCLLGFGGRWGNHVYMMNNALYIALKHNLTLHLPWSDFEPVLPNMQRFNTPCPTDLPEIHRNDAWWKRIADPWWDTDPRTVPDNRNFTTFKYTIGGYMQYPTWAHASYRTDIMAYYAPRSDLRELMDRIKAAIMTEYCSDTIVVAIHIRAGDFPKPEQWNYSSGVESPIQIPITWYISYLNQLTATQPALLQQLKQWQDSECPQPVTALNMSAPFSVFLATEDMTNVAALRNASFRTMSLQEAVAVTPGLGKWTTLTGRPGAFWAEWWLLSQFRVLITSHSSFSLTAAMQSPYYESRQAVYATPDPVTLSIQPFDPWNISYDHSAFTRRGKQIVFG